jgi:ketosteroid isomerase-like protein
VSDTRQFLDEMMPRIHQTETALHNGDAGPRGQMWSHTDTVTVFGAAFSPIGWAEVGPMFEKLASNFSSCSSCEWEVVDADGGDDFAYLLAIDRTTTSVGSSERTPHMLRSTTIFRRENGEWKIVHRHADPIDQSAQLLSRLHGNQSEAGPREINPQGHRSHTAEQMRQRRGALSGSERLAGVASVRAGIGLGVGES